MRHPGLLGVTNKVLENFEKSIVYLWLSVIFFLKTQIKFLKMINIDNRKNTKF